MNRNEARRRGLSAAARIAGLTGFVAAGVSIGPAEPAHRIEPEQARAPHDASQAEADAVPAVGIVGATAGCLVPRWGPPAPPPFDPEGAAIFEAMLEADVEEATS